MTALVTLGRVVEYGQLRDEGAVSAVAVASPVASKHRQKSRIACPVARSPTKAGLVSQRARFGRAWASGAGLGWPSVGVMCLPTSMGVSRGPSERRFQP